MVSTNITLTPINICSFNVNDMGQDTKRQSIFNKIKHDNGIILLQETHSTVKTEKKGNMNGEGKLIFHMAPQISEGYPHFDLQM